MTTGLTLFSLICSLGRSFIFPKLLLIFTGCLEVCEIVTDYQWSLFLRLETMISLLSCDCCAYRLANCVIHPWCFKILSQPMLFEIVGIEKCCIFIKVFVNCGDGVILHKFRSYEWFKFWSYSLLLVCQLFYRGTITM